MCLTLYSGAVSVLFEVNALSKKRRKPHASCDTYIFLARVTGTQSGILCGCTRYPAHNFPWHKQSTLRRALSGFVEREQDLQGPCPYLLLSQAHDDLVNSWRVTLGI